jgi:hypothetical protein
VLLTPARIRIAAERLAEMDDVEVNPLHISYAEEVLMAAFPLGKKTASITSFDNLDCPFCGGKVDPEGWASSEKRGPECVECGATAPDMETWNRRQSEAGTYEVLMRVTSSLVAAVSILERTPSAKKSMASDRMFDQCIKDYRDAFESARKYFRDGVIPEVVEMPSRDTLAKAVLGPYKPVPPGAKYTLADLREVRWSDAESCERARALTITDAIIRELKK